MSSKPKKSSSKQTSKTNRDKVLFCGYFCSLTIFTKQKLLCSNVIVLSGCHAEEREQLTESLQILGDCEVAEEMTDDCTHVVLGSVKNRTLKILFGIATGKLTFI